MKTLSTTLLLSVFAANSFAQPATKRMSLDMGEGCHISVKVPPKAEGGALRADPEKNVRGRASIGVTAPPRATRVAYEDVFGMTLGCYDVTENLTDGYPVRYDEVQRKWVKDMDRFLEKQVWKDELTKEDRRQYSAAVKFYGLSPLNAHGFAFTQDDMIGDERGRRRHMRYCLFRAQKAVCGESTVALLSDIKRDRRNDLTQYALRILRSIEFVSDVGPAARSLTEEELGGSINSCAR